eukprot:scaffold11564_cov116-Isochrysis_galbana.AAC.5
MPSLAARCTGHQMQRGLGRQYRPNSLRAQQDGRQSTCAAQVEQSGEPVELRCPVPAGQGDGVPIRDGDVHLIGKEIHTIDEVFIGFLVALAQHLRALCLAQVGELSDVERLSASFCQIRGICGRVRLWVKTIWGVEGASASLCAAREASHGACATTASPQVPHLLHEAKSQATYGLIVQLNDAQPKKAPLTWSISAPGTQAMPSYARNEPRLLLGSAILITNDSPSYMMLAHVGRYSACPGLSNSPKSWCECTPAESWKRRVHESADRLRSRMLAACPLSLKQLVNSAL